MAQPQNNKEILIVNINNNIEGQVTSPWQIFNYFLITLSVITGLICLAQFCKKFSDKLKRSPLTAYGLQAIARNPKGEQNQICECNHKYKLHVIGSPLTVTTVFPRLRYTHI